ncbi:MAG: alpha/beta hydrolase [Candidatus Dormibacteraeota bacterium]|nr:alpha/beta hydrolase [Candidatus Dormibacteraeota bacterium]
MSTEAFSAPRGGLPLTFPRPRLAVEWLSTRDQADWPTPPAGNGQPVMLIPGFLAGDASLTRMAVWLRTGGYQLARSGIAWNTGCMEVTVQRLQQRLEAAVRRTGRPALIVGQSRGGAIGRALSVLRPDLVETLVTLGSPLLDQLAVKPRVWPSIVTVGTLGTLGVPGMFAYSCLRGECCSRTRNAVGAPFPEGPRFLSLYSRSDEVVRWRACLDPGAEAIEVHTSHVGMGMALEVWTALSAALG